MKYLIIGSGLFGATFAHEAAERGNKVTVIERRNHIAGGKRAMYLKSCHQVVAYSDIDWVYIRENAASWHGLQIYHSKTVELFGRRHISTKMDTEELKMLLGGYVAPVQRELLVGYTPGNKAEYERRRRMRGGA